MKPLSTAESELESGGSGLLHALVLDGRGRATACPVEQLDGWEPAAGPLWLHFDFTALFSREWLSERSGLDPVASEALLTVESRPRVTRIGDGVLLASRGVNLNAGATPDDMIGVRVWVDEYRVITSLRRNLYSVTDLVETLRAGDGPDSPVGVVGELARRLVTRMSDTVDNMEELIAELEE